MVIIWEVSFAIYFVTNITNVKHHLQFYSQSVYIEKVGTHERVVVMLCVFNEWW